MRGTTLVLAVTTLLVVFSCRGDSGGGPSGCGCPLAISTTTLPGAAEGQAYSFFLKGGGGVAPYSWAVTAGSLPAGMGIDGSTGEISGVPPTPPPEGQYPFTVTLTDGHTPPGSVARAFLLNVAPVNFPPCSGSLTTGYPPLDDPVPQTYLGIFATELYGSGNLRPTAHTLAAPGVEPLDTGGNPSPAGSYVLLSIGMSNTTQEFTAFIGLAAGDPEVNAQHLVIIDGAAGGQGAATWDSPTDPNYDRVLNQELAPAGLTEEQVQAAWVKVANPGPSLSLPDPGADAFTLVGQMGGIVRALKVRYPNIRQVYLSSRIYAGFATTGLNPEPYAYESGFSVKWLIQAQLDQVAGGGIDPLAGDLDPGGVAPWLSWGPYLWSDGFAPRSSDGYYWTCTDLEADGTHPSTSGRLKVANSLLLFLKTDPVARGWFLADP